MNGFLDCLLQAAAATRKTIPTGVYNKLKQAFNDACKWVII
jgi:hypothetical protein